MTEGYARKRSRVWTVARLLLVIVVFTLLWRGVQLGYAYAGASPRFTIMADQVGFLSPSPWLDEDDLLSIRRDSGLAGERFSFFDPSVTGPSAWARASARSRPRSATVTPVLRGSRAWSPSTPGTRIEWTSSSGFASRRPGS